MDDPGRRRTTGTEVGLQDDFWVEHPDEGLEISDAERAALDYATELTTNKEVSRDIVWLVASEHFYNMSNHGLNIGSDGLCDLRVQRTSESLVGASEKKAAS